jgi:hypothetical protein
MFSRILFLFLLTLPYSAFAYLPPAFFVYSQIAEQRAKTQLPFLVITVSKPMGSDTEEVIGNFLLPPWQKEKGGWPTLSILLQGEAEELIQSVSQFGIPVQKETDLLRANKEQVSAMKAPPKPFYRLDKRMGLKRFRETYSWVHKEADRSIWIEKDSFFPLKIEGPCPNEVAELSWAKAGENKCEVDFRNILSLRRGTPQNSRITLWKDGQRVLFFTIDRMLNSKPSGSNLSGINTEIQSIANQILR